ncbi:MAG: TonB family protein [Alphaproteobacteria bacterium]|nr:MAG: TonB family protein [Alphaproteobacteria bacterium]
MNSWLTAVLKGRRAVTAAAILMLSGFSLAQPATADEMDDWRKAVVKKIGEEHIYPRSAIQREVEGVAKVKVTIDRTGAITTYDIVEPTGESVLDKVIPKIMEKLNPLPAPPDSMSDDSLTFVIPFAWRLR